MFANSRLGLNLTPSSKYLLLVLIKT